MLQKLTATSPSKWNCDKRIFQFVKVHCLHCNVATDSMANTKIHVSQCQGMYDVRVICGCCGQKYERWRCLHEHINQGG